MNLQCLLLVPVRETTSDKTSWEDHLPLVATQTPSKWKMGRREWPSVRINLICHMMKRTAHTSRRNPQVGFVLSNFIRS